VNIGHGPCQVDPACEESLGGSAVQPVMPYEEPTALLPGGCEAAARFVSRASPGLALRLVTRIHAYGLENPEDPFRAEIEEFLSCMSELGY
jgi:hypothetical protein